MSVRRLNDFVDDLATGRRPRNFQASSEDADIVRAAIAIRAERPGDTVPDTTFVESLRRELRDLSDSGRAATAPATRRLRDRTALFGVAAAVALLGGTFAVTETAMHGSAQRQAMQAPHGQALRTASFETPSGQVMGQLVVYRGSPSWVFMSVDVPQGSGFLQCELHLANGAVVAAGVVHLDDGRGEISRTIRIDPTQLRSATLSNSSGVTLASAAFT